MLLCRAVTTAASTAAGPVGRTSPLRAAPAAAGLWPRCQARRPAGPGARRPRARSLALRASADGEAATLSSSPPPAAARKVLVLGGSGFVGGAICAAAARAGFAVVAVSRRGRPPAGSADAGGSSPIDWRQADLTEGEGEDPVRAILREGGFCGVVHAVGLLFDSAAGPLAQLNPLASGSGSVPAADATYDAVTRRSALTAAAAAAELLPRGSPFVFVSAAEAAWTADPPTPGDFLRRYLIAKRAVEGDLLARGARGELRPAVLRPSLVWTPDRPAAVPAVAAFTALNALGVPFVDRPVRLETLAAAAIGALEDETVQGILDYRRMEALAVARGVAL